MNFLELLYVPFNLAFRGNLLKELQVYDNIRNFTYYIYIADIFFSFNTGIYKKGVTLMKK